MPSAPSSWRPTARSPIGWTRPTDGASPIATPRPPSMSEPTHGLPGPADRSAGSATRPVTPRSQPRSTGNDREDVHHQQVVIVEVGHGRQPCDDDEGEGEERRAGDDGQATGDERERDAGELRRADTDERLEGARHGRRERRPRMPVPKRTAPGRSRTRSRCRPSAASGRTALPRPNPAVSRTRETSSGVDQKTTVPGTSLMVPPRPDRTPIEVRPRPMTQHQARSPARPTLALPKATPSAKPRRVARPKQDEREFQGPHASELALQDRVEAGDEQPDVQRQPGHQSRPERTRTG